MSENNPININLIPKLPDSTTEAALNPSAMLVGQAFRGIVHKVFDPLVKYNIVKEKEMTDFADKVKKGTSEIPIEHRDDSHLGLTFKAAEDSSYQINSEKMRELFANLIKSTVDDRKNSSVHPSFSSILKDLSSTDAFIFSTIYKNNLVPLVSIRLYVKQTGHGVNTREHIMLINGERIEEVSSLNVLQRFGLIEINPSGNLVADKFVKEYSLFKTAVDIINLERELPYEGLDSLQIVEGHVKVSSLGKEFGFTVIDD